MQNNYEYVIGLMSGTSLDGLDMAYVQFHKKNAKDFKIIDSITVPYSNAWKDKLQQAITFSDDHINQLHRAYGDYLGERVCQFMTDFNIDKVDFIASHGHTIFHQPEKGVTLQIGDGQRIANITKQQVICDFRTQDVALGGQGAPLVPIGDELLFNDYEYCLNLGGFANVSYHNNGERLAFDVCPVNIVLNHYVQQLGLAYDDKGEIAAKGDLNEELLAQLNALAFYNTPAPKSLGLEWVKAQIFPLIDRVAIDVPSILRTFVEHCACQIGNVIAPNASVLITGGGAFNTFLIERIEEKTKTIIKLPDDNLIHFKEALIFAFLGLLKRQNKTNCLKSVTGASKNHSSGQIFYPKLKD